MRVPANPPVLSVALASAAALAWEVLLVRLFSITHWHHYAYMVISLALLGYGASGAFLALLQRRFEGHVVHAYLGNLLLFPLAIVSSYTLAAGNAVNPEELLWDPLQWLQLVAVYLYLAVPFFFVANAIGLALMSWRRATSRLYGADLLGAAFGSAAVVITLLAVFPQTAIRLVVAAAIAAALLAAFELRTLRRSTTVLAIAGSVLLWQLPATLLKPQPSIYKDLSQQLQIVGARLIEERSSPLGLLSVVANERIPLRHAPGLSLSAASAPPPQLALFVDGAGPSAITRYRAGDHRLDYLDQLGWALPYHLARPQRVLIVGAGGGSDVLQALTLGARHIDALEVNPQLSDLVRHQYAGFTGNLYDNPAVAIFNAEARDFLDATRHRYDLIQVALVDSHGASAAGLYALNESYLYTVEALQAYLSRLEPGGYVAMSRWIKLPARDTPRLFATAIAALEATGVENPGDRLMLIRSWQTSTLLIKNGCFDAAEIDAMRTFVRERSFDVSYYPGMSATEANRYNRMAEPYLFNAARALLGPQPAAFLSDYKFDITPVSDDRPFFFQFFKWQTLPEIIGLVGRGGTPLLDSGYLLLIATLLQALAAAALLILLPLLYYRGRYAARTPAAQRRRVLMYFTALGIAFLFMELAFIQKFVLLLHHPLYAVAVILAAFLVFAGLGSLYSRRLIDTGRGLALPVTAIVLLSLGYLLLLGPLFTSLAGSHLAVRILVTVALVAPLAFCMGIPFPLGLARLARGDSTLLPWAWGINGSASVISAVAATLIAMHFGFSLVVVAAAMLYAFAACVLPR